MTCGVCRADMRDGSSRCVKCGAKVGETAPAAAERTSSGRLKDRQDSGRLRPDRDGAAYPRPTRTGATVWQVLTDHPHTVELVLNQLSGREIVVVDGRELVNALKWGFSSEHRVPLGNQTGTLTVAMGLGGTTASLRVEGREVTPTSTATFVQAKGAAPAWSYAFSAACFAIPLVTLGGAIPVALGFGAGAACQAIAKDANKSIGARVVLCAVVTAAAWGLLGAILLVVMSSR